MLQFLVVTEFTIIPNIKLQCEECVSAFCIILTKNIDVSLKNNTTEFDLYWTLNVFTVLHELYLYTI